MNKVAVLKKVNRLIDLWESGQIPRMHKHEVHPDVSKGSRERYLYFTLPTSLNFQRQSSSMWSSALATWEDSETNYLFFPEKVVRVDYLKIQSDLRKHKLSLQVNKHTDIWVRLCKSFNDHWEDDPRKLIVHHQSCTTRIITYLQGNKTEFPYLNGNKMSNYWLYILDSYTDIQLRNKHKLSIIPDTHIQQCSMHLGLTTKADKPDAVASAWFELLQGQEIAPVSLHPVLWNWSRNKFLPPV